VFSNATPRTTFLNLVPDPQKHLPTDFYEVTVLPYSADIAVEIKAVSTTQRHCAFHSKLGGD
jgi:hypothetical protein